MAFLTVKNVVMRGISACVPSNIEENENLSLFKEGEAARVITSTGIHRKRVVDSQVTTSDLAVKAAEVLLEKLGWNRDSIDCLIFVSSSRDYITPSTSCIVQDRLGFSENCYTIDIPYGCTGWIYGTSVISSLLSHGNMKRGILLAGDTSTKMSNPGDKESRPLFGDAATATAFEYDPEAEESFHFVFGTDGKGHEAIITYDGGMRRPFNEESLKEVSYGNNIVRRNIDCKIDGMNVFAFGISKAPLSVLQLMKEYDLKEENIDYLLLHQANRYMNEKIRKKTAFPAGKVPYSLDDFGNTSCASIPLTIISRVKESFIKDYNRCIACAFGVGLSWGSMYFSSNKLICPDLIEY